MKAAPNRTQRFSGDRGKQLLLECIIQQRIVAGDVAVAQALYDVGSLLEVKTNETVAIQGSSENELYLIVAGRVSVRVNDREVAIRETGSHVGEMAVIDSTALRSATLVSLEPSALLKISERDFSDVAAAHPSLWRRVAVELAARLRERSKFHKPPHSQPVIFVASSSEGKTVAAHIGESLRRRHPTVVRLWWDGVFQASKTTIEDLCKQSSESDFAVIVVTPDDKVASRGSSQAAPRDNIIFELGLFVGALGRERVFIVAPNGIDLKIPSDLLGVTTLRYRSKGPVPLWLKLKAAKQQIVDSIREQGPR